MLSFILIALILLLNLISSLSNNKDVSSVSNTICYNISMILSIQQKQLQIIRKELLVNREVKMDTTESLYKNAISFYTKSYNKIYLQRSHIPDSGSSSSLNNSKVIIFYDIRKNGNDNMRYYLCNYLFYLSNKDLCCSKNNYHDDIVCNLSFEDIGNIAYRRDMLKPDSTVFSFALIRHPIHRFISAYNEMEYRKDWKVFIRKKNQLLHFEPRLPIGKIDRFLEFIKLVVKEVSPIIGDMSPAAYWHILPVIGTLLHGLKNEKRIPNIYKLENFDSDIHRLSLESELFKLAESYQFCNKSEIVRHHTSNDPMGLRALVNSFFTYAKMKILSIQ